MACLRVLELNEGATEGDVRSAYRLLARRYHPDRHDGARWATERFQVINGAYQYLREGDTAEAAADAAPDVGTEQRSAADPTDDRPEEGAPEAPEGNLGEEEPEEDPEADGPTWADWERVQEQLDAAQVLRDAAIARMRRAEVEAERMREVARRAEREALSMAEELERSQQQAATLARELRRRNAELVLLRQELGGDPPGGAEPVPPGGPPLFPAGRGRPRTIPAGMESNVGSATAAAPQYRPAAPAPPAGPRPPTPAAAREGSPKFPGAGPLRFADVRVSPDGTPSGRDLRLSHGCRVRLGLEKQCTVPPPPVDGPEGVTLFAGTTYSRVPRPQRTMKTIVCDQGVLKMTVVPDDDTLIEAISSTGNMLRDERRRRLAVTLGLGRPGSRLPTEDSLCPHLWKWLDHLTLGRVGYGTMDYRLCQRVGCGYYHCKECHLHIATCSKPSHRRSRGNRR